MEYFMLGIEKVVCVNLHAHLLVPERKRGTIIFFILYLIMSQHIDRQIPALAPTGNIHIQRYQHTNYMYIVWHNLK
jgi:hypothetical protein